MTRQASLFDAAPAPAPSSAPQPVVAQPGKPPGWRAPDLPREHVCRTCQGAATCGIGEAWFCRPCAPADFWPRNRGAA